MKRNIGLVLLAGMLLAGCNRQADTDVKTTGETTGQITEHTTEQSDMQTTEQTMEQTTEQTDTEAVQTQTAESTTAETTTQFTTAELEKEKIIMNGIEIAELCPESIAEHRKDVTYGTVVHKTYFSNTTGLERGVNVLVPADYDEAKQYPVLYLLHGIFGDEYSFTNDANNRIPEIMGNLAADGLAEEMIVVLPNMYATTDPELKPGFTNEAVLPYDNFINDLVNDLIPYIEEHYSVISDRNSRAIAGFSMGGRETLFIGLSRPDLFAYVGAIAPAPGLTPGKDWAMTHPGQLTEEELTFSGKEYEPKVLMVCCGTKDSVVGKFPQSYHEIFDKNGTAHVWYEVPGADHDNVAIKSGLYNYVRAIFK